MQTLLYLHTFMDLQTICIYAMAHNAVVMARTRALMTETERQYVAGETDVSDSKRYQAISRIRDRFEALEADVETLEEHHADLLEEIREIVCEDGPATEEVDE